MDVAVCGVDLATETSTMSTEQKIKKYLQHIFFNFRLCGANR